MEIFILLCSITKNNIMTHEAKQVLDLQEKQFKTASNWIVLINSPYLEPEDKRKCIENYCELLTKIADLIVSASCSKTLPIHDNA